jgi:plasmid stabilization system protein ParE
MSLPIVFRPAAREEYDRAFAWYEGQQPGLGVRFEEEIERVVAEIAVHPKRYPVVVRDIREAPVRRFPYCVYYRVRRGRLIVLSVFHTSRNPNEWQSRV